MANVHFVFYERNRGTVARRPAVLSVVLDETVTPTLSTYDLNATEHAYVRLSTFDPNALSTGKSVTVNSLATLPSTSADYEVGRQVILTLEEEQAQQQATLDTLIANTDWTQSLDSMLTLASRNAFKAYRDELEGIPVPTSPYYQATWATVPENIVNPEEPTPAYASNDLGSRPGELAGDNAFSSRHLFMPDKMNLAPDMTFADADAPLFQTANCTISFIATGNRSGGYAMVITKTSAAGAGAASVRSLASRFFSLEGEAGYIVEFNHRGHTGDVTGAVAVQLETFQNDKATTAGDSARSFENTLGATWTRTRYQHQVSSTSRWGRAGIFLATGLPAGTQVRVDGVTIKRASRPGDLDATLGGIGDVVAKHTDGTWLPRSMAWATFSFSAANIAAGVGAAMDRIFANGASAIAVVTRDVQMPRSGRVIGMTLEASAAVTGGTITGRVRLNNSAVTFDGNSVQLSVSNASNDASLVSYANGVPFAAGDLLGVNLLTANTPTTYAPTTNDYLATLIVQFDPF